MMHCAPSDGVREIMGSEGREFDHVMTLLNQDTYDAALRSQRTLSKLRVPSVSIQIPSQNIQTAAFSQPKALSSAIRVYAQDLSVLTFDVSCDL